MTTMTSRHPDRSALSAICLQIKEAIEKADTVLTVSHVDPDGDALGTQLAFSEYLRGLGKKVIPVRESLVPDKYAFLPGIDSLIDIATLESAPTFDLAIVFECPTLDRTGGVAEYLQNSSKIISIDHHPESHEIGDIHWLDIKSSSVGEMVCEYFEIIEQQISESMATNLYTAILTDTGRFRFSSTTQRTLEFAGKLVGAGANPKQVVDKVYFNMLPSTMLLTGKVLCTLEFQADGKICLLTMTQQMLKDTGAHISESDGLVDFTLFARGVTTGALLKELEDGTTKISLRSNNGINVAAIAANFGGGGHFNAAGCHVAKTPSEAREELLALLTEANNA